MLHSMKMKVNLKKNSRKRMAGAPEKEQSDMTDNWANIMSEVADLEKGITDEEVHQD